jgi:hypothetical protein
MTTRAKRPNGSTRHLWHGIETDLTVTPGEGHVEITTGAFGVRLLQGEKTYREPASAKDVPGPVIAMRLADGTWFGGSRMFGPGKIEICSARLVDRGPVFARVAFRYTYEAAAGRQAHLIRRRVRPGGPGRTSGGHGSQGPLITSHLLQVLREEDCGHHGIRLAELPRTASPLRSFICTPLALHAGCRSG